MRSFLLIFLIVLSFSYSSSLESQRGMIFLQTQNARHVAHQLETQYDVLAYDHMQGRVEIFGTPKEFEQLIEQGFKGYFVSEKDYLKTHAFTKDDYKDLPEIEEELLQLEMQYPNLAQRVSLMDAYNVPRTYEGREVFALKISDNVQTHEDEPRIAFIGNHHAREVQTPETVLDTARWLLSQYTKNAQAQKWVENYEIWLVPVANPDGYTYMYNTDRWWRKNRREGHGVDINRNYPHRWGEGGNNSKSKGSQVYIGPSPASEPETQALMALSLAEKFWISISYHSSGKEVLYPYAYRKLDPIEETVRDRFVEGYRNVMGFEKRVASSEGEDFEWRFNAVGGISFLTELSTTFWPDYEKFQQIELPVIRKGWMYLLDRISKGLITGTVVSEKGNPLQARIEIEEITPYEQEVRESDQQTGRYFWYLPEGEYTLKVSHKGFESFSQKIKIQENAQTQLHVLLKAKYEL